MILDRKTYKDIEAHFKTYKTDREYVSLRSQEIAENITSVPGGSSKSRPAAPDPTGRKAIRIENELGPIISWLQVIESTEKYFDEEAKKLYGDVKYGKGEYIRLLYYDAMPQFKTMAALDLSEGTFYAWRRDILNRAAILASGKGLIE